MAAAGQIANLSATLSVKRSDGTSKLLAVKSGVSPGDSPPTLIINGKKVPIPQNIGGGIGKDKDSSCTL